MNRFIFLKDINSIDSTLVDLEVKFAEENMQTHSGRVGSDSGAGFVLANERRCPLVAQ